MLGRQNCVQGVDVSRVHVPCKRLDRHACIHFIRSPSIIGATKSSTRTAISFFVVGRLSHASKKELSQLRRRLMSRFDRSYVRYLEKGRSLSSGHLTAVDAAKLRLEFELDSYVAMRKVHVAKSRADISKWSEGATLSECTRIKVCRASRRAEPVSECLSLVVQRNFNSDFSLPRLRSAAHNVDTDHIEDESRLCSLDYSRLPCLKIY